MIDCIDSPVKVATKKLSSKRTCFKLYVKKVDVTRIDEEFLAKQFINVGPRLPDTMVLVCYDEVVANKFYRYLTHVDNNIPTTKDW